jgi:hypothetical protein
VFEFLNIYFVAMSSLSESVKGVKSLALQKKLAMELFNCGQRKVWINPDVSRWNAISQARTRMLKLQWITNEPQRNKLFN